MYAKDETGENGNGEITSRSRAESEGDWPGIWSMRHYRYEHIEQTISACLLIVVLQINTAVQRLSLYNIACTMHICRCLDARCQLWSTCVGSSGLWDWLSACSWLAESFTWSTGCLCQCLRWWGAVRSRSEHAGGKVLIVSCWNMSLLFFIWLKFEDLSSLEGYSYFYFVIIFCLKLVIS